MSKEIIYHCDGCETLINAEQFIAEIKVQEEITTPIDPRNLDKGSVKQLKVDLLHSCRKCYEAMTKTAQLAADNRASEQSLED